MPFLDEGRGKWDAEVDNWRKGCMEHTDMVLKVP